MGPEVLGQPQIGQVPPLQIDLDGTAGSLQHQPPLGPALLKLVQAMADRLPSRPKPVPVVVLSAGNPSGTTAVDHVAGAVSPRLEQHRVHRRAGFQAGRPGLHRLGVGHFMAAGIHPGVVAHVLPLERQGLFAATSQHPAEGCCHQGFPRSAGGAQHHQGLCRRSHGVNGARCGAGRCAAGQWGWLRC